MAAPTVVQQPVLPVAQDPTLMTGRHPAAQVQVHPGLPQGHIQLQFSTQTVVLHLPMLPSPNLMPSLHQSQIFPMCFVTEVQPDLLLSVQAEELQDIPMTGRLPGEQEPLHQDSMQELIW